MNRLQFLHSLAAGAGSLAAARLGAEVADGAVPAWPVEYREAEAFWRTVRAQYSVESGLVYLNTGGLGPSPRPVLDIRDLTARALQTKVESGHFFFEEARTIVARFFGAAADELCFTRNATEGNSIVASGLDLRAGDEVVLETHAHPGGSLPWLNLARREGVVIRTFEPDAASAAGNVARIAALLGPRTRVVQVSHVTAPTGIVMPVAELAPLCRGRGVWLHVDGAQSAGMIPVDLAALGCDSYAASGHKWLGGPRESGVLFIRRAQIERVAPLHLGAYSSGEFDFTGQVVYTDGVRRHEYGTRDAATVVALAEATRFQSHIGRERLAARNAALVAQFVAAVQDLPRLELLTPADPALRAAMITFRVQGLPSGRVFGTLLEKHRLRCRPVSEERLDAVRVSFHLFNTPEHVEQLADAMRLMVRA